MITAANVIRGGARIVPANPHPADFNAPKVLTIMQTLQGDKRAAFESCRKKRENTGGVTRAGRTENFSHCR